MKLKFKRQPFQEAAARAVCDVFRGQRNQIGRYTVDPGLDDGQQFTIVESLGYKNAELDDGLTNDVLRQNLWDVQDRQRLPHTQDFADGINLSVEMETGTGKTYTYIKTMYELNKAYGWSKFIIVVPSIAIREGVKKSFETTQEHFTALYGKAVRFFVYDSKNLPELERFANEASIAAMIINVQAFNARSEAARRIYRKLEDFKSRRPIDVIAATRPILIIDEPQSVEGTAAKKTKKALKDFKALFTLRYSATLPKEYNLVYNLDAIDAYNMKLVKKIAVKGITASGTTATDGYLYLESINVSQKKNPTATLAFECKTKSGVRRKTHIVGEGYRIYDNSGEFEEYRMGYTVDRINANTNTVTLANGITLHPGEAVGDVSEDQLRRIQIRETILSHIERESMLFQQGIKVLSLFFIDEVAKYRVYDAGSSYHNGVYADMFEEEYRDVIAHLSSDEYPPDYLAYLRQIPAEKTHDGYFSMDKKGKMINSTLKSKETSSDDVAAYDLIMKNKELLLDLNPRRSPVRFIFSHSALKEGWDNPNVFQICTLKQSSSETRKRQEVGRGMRLCVNQDGERMDEARLKGAVQKVNLLTVIASESYETFARDLQHDISASIVHRPRKVDGTLFFDKKLSSNDGTTFIRITEAQTRAILHDLIRREYIDDDDHLTPAYQTARETGTFAVAEALADYSDAIGDLLDSVYSGHYDGLEDGKGNNARVRVNEENLRKKAFQELWGEINQKSAYTVSFDTEELVQNAVRALNEKLSVATLYFEVAEGRMEQIASKEQLQSGRAFVRESDGAGHRLIHARPNRGVKYDLVGKLVAATGLTRRTVAEILTGIDGKTFGFFKVNPEEFIRKAGELINDEKAAAVIEHITYHVLDDRYTTDVFTAAQANARLDVNALEVEKSVYDHVVYDSTNERQFAEALEAHKDVVVYVKLPDGFFINTPVGHYNPDWAIAFREGAVKHIYFVAETKGSMRSMELRGIEKSKIACARKHFAAISSEHVRYDVVNSYDELLKKVM